MICKNCGKQIDDNQNFCPYCGNNVSELKFSWETTQGVDAPVTNPEYNNQNQSVNNQVNENPVVSQPAQTPVYNNPTYNQGQNQPMNNQPVFNNQQPGGPAYNTQPAYNAQNYNTPVNNGPQYGGYGYQQNWQQSEVKNYNLISAYKEMFKKYAKFDGRSRRSEYWYAYLANCIIMMGVYFLMLIPIFVDLAAYGEPSGFSAVFAVLIAIFVMIYAFAILVPTLALEVRRLHDIGKSGWYLLLGLIPYVGSIIILVFMCMDSQMGPNMYGPNPKGQ